MRSAKRLATGDRRSTRGPRGGGRGDPRGLRRARVPGPCALARAGAASVINATGVIVHTNLGRAAWPRAAIEAARLAAEGPVLLEMDRATGRRGARSRAAEEHLVALTGAEDALVVTNNAAAIALAVGLAGSRRRRRRVAGRARRDRRRRPDPGDPATGRRPPHRGRDDEPDAGRRLRGRARRRKAEDPRSSCASTLELRPVGVRGGARSARGSPRPPTATGRSSSTTSGAGRCSRPSGSGSRTSRCPPSGSPRAPTS